MAERRCGACEHWEALDEWEDGKRNDCAIGHCRYPLPSCIPDRLRMFAKAGKDCPTWHPKPT